MTNGKRHPTQHAALERVARGGYVVTGLLHIAIGYLAVQVAMRGQNTADPDPSGAFATLAQEAGGRAALWLAAVCFLAMAVWRFIETFVGRAVDIARELSWFDRLSAFSLVLVYAGLGYLALRYAMGSEPDDGQAVAFTGRLMRTIPGTVLLLTAGVIAVIVGATHIYKGANRKFIDDLMGNAGVLLRSLGIAGYIGKGAVIVTVGVLVMIATVRSQPEEAAGLDAALRSLAERPYGAVFLILSAIALAIFGIFSLVMAWRAKM